MPIFIHACFLLAFAHVISDYMFTSDFIYNRMISSTTPKKDYLSIRRRAEEAHGLIAGFAVYVVCLHFNVRYAFAMAIIETILHIIIDHHVHDEKKEHSHEFDQVLHYICKLMFALYISITTITALHTS